MTRQRAWQLRKQAAGLCVICGKPKADGSKQSCLEHLEKNRVGNRERTGHKPWRPGGRGRPPKN